VAEGAFWNNYKGTAIPAGSTTISSPSASGANAAYRGTAGTTNVAADPFIADLLAMSNQDRLMVSELLVRAGYLKTPTSKYNKSLGDAYQRASNDWQVESARTGREGFTFRQFLQENAAAPAGGAGVKGPSTQKTVRVDDNTTAEQKVVTAFERLGITPTPEQVKEWREKLQEEQRKKPITTKYVTKGGVQTATTTGGLDDDFWLQKNLGTTFKTEIEEASLVDRDTAARDAAKRVFDKVTKGLTGDALTKAAAKTEYGRAINSIKARINEYLLEAGGELEDIAGTAAEIYDLGIEGDSAQIREFLRDKINLGENLGGRAGTNLDKLRKTARANGLDLDKAFGGQIKGWLQNLERGEDIETYNRIIRGVAKLGLPDKVAALLDQGVDLQTVYEPYRRQMATLLEVEDDQIDLDDPLLRSAIGPDKEMSIYDFKRAVRKDPRWQYTDNAREEVSDVALRVLKDFGFQG
jgi:hypothetical protein